MATGPPDNKIKKKIQARTRSAVDIALARLECQVCSIASTVLWIFFRLCLESGIKREDTHTAALGDSGASLEFDFRDPPA
jgi:hypothetical protein